MTWEHGGFVLYYKMLEKGRFRLPTFQEGQSTVLLESAELAMLLNGFDDTQPKRPRHWTLPKKLELWVRLRDQRLSTAGLIDKPVFTAFSVFVWLG